MINAGFVIFRCDYYNYEDVAIAILKDSLLVSDVPRIGKYHDFVVSNFLEFFMFSENARLRYIREDNRYEVISDSGDPIGHYEIKNIPLI